MTGLKGNDAVPVAVPERQTCSRVEVLELV